MIAVAGEVCAQIVEEGDWAAGSVCEWGELVTVSARLRLLLWLRTCDARPWTVLKCLLHSMHLLSSRDVEFFLCFSWQFLLPWKKYQISFSCYYFISPEMSFLRLNLLYLVILESSTILADHFTNITPKGSSRAQVMLLPCLVHHSDCWHISYVQGRHASLHTGRKCILTVKVPTGSVHISKLVKIWLIQQVT